MILAKRLKGKAIATWLGPSGDAARRALTRARQTLTAAPRRLDLYVDIADPISHLVAQAVARLIAVYPVELAVRVVTPPASDVDPAPALRARHAVRDAGQLAEYWNLAFAAHREADPGMVREIGTALIRDRPGRDQLTAFTELTSAMWRGDKQQVGQLVLRYGADSSNAIAPILNTHYAELRKAGGFHGASVLYDGGLYTGIDRLPYLEARLAADLGVAAPPVVTPRPETERGPLRLSDKPLACELWFSFRSPYSYLALERVEGVLAPHGVPLVAKPVPPMAARGLRIAEARRRAFVRDAKREADRLGIPFGELCDPLDAGVDNCLTIAHHAAARGQLVAFARSALRGIWAEALDMAAYVDLRRVVERAGLSWQDAHAQLRDSDAVAAARKAAHANAAELAVYSLWGVPSLRCGDFIAWGQDRLPLLADRLRRHALAAA